MPKLSDEQKVFIVTFIMNRLGETELEILDAVRTLLEKIVGKRAVERLLEEHPTRRYIT